MRYVHSVEDCYISVKINKVLSSVTSLKSLLAGVYRLKPWHSVPFHKMV